MNDPLKPYRRKLRSWNNRRRLAAEREHYERLFSARGLTIPDDSDTNLAILSMFPSLRPKQKGALSIIAIYHNYNWEDGTLKPALGKFGNVRHYDWFERFDHSARDWRRAVKEEMNRDLLMRIGEWVEEERPDVIFTYLSGELVSPGTVEVLRTLGVPMIHFSLNDKENFVGKARGGLAFGSRDICRRFDLCWTSTEDALKKYCVEGAIPVYLPEGANPEIHRPLDIEKTIDVSFVGQCYGNRPVIVSHIGKAGFDIKAFGVGWPEGPLSTEAMVRVYSQSRINLGFGGVAGHDETYCLKGRDFEIPMSGGLYLTEYHSELETVYDLGKEIETYRGIDDLLIKIRHFLNNPDKAEEIRQAGLRRALMNHTWEMRFERIFKLMNLVNSR